MFFRKGKLKFLNALDKLDELKIILYLVSHPDHFDLAGQIFIGAFCGRTKEQHYLEEVKISLF